LGLRAFFLPESYPFAYPIPPLSGVIESGPGGVLSCEVPLLEGRPPLRREVCPVPRMLAASVTFTRSDGRLELLRCVSREFLRLHGASEADLRVVVGALSILPVEPGRPETLECILADDPPESGIFSLRHPAGGPDDLLRCQGLSSTPVP
jgi:hypothetical protein